MQVDRDGLIFGIRPAQLKRLMRNDVIATPNAMVELGLNEPGCSNLLQQLALSGWITFDGVRDHTDYWRIADPGVRLRATKLIKRFPLELGRKIVSDVILEARAINRDPRSSRRVTKVALFGSVLTANAGETVGDVDIVVDVVRRPLPKAQLLELEAAEMAKMPPSVDSFAREFRISNDVLRRIKKVSSRISIHQDADIRMGNPHSIVYAYDDEREAELPVTGEILVIGEPPQPQEHRRIGHGVFDTAKLVPSWPAAPQDPASEDYCRIEDLYRAQHLWINGASLPVIAGATRLNERSALTYLAARPEVRTVADHKFDASLKATLNQLPSPVNGIVYVEIRFSPGSQPLARVQLFEPESHEQLARIRQSSATDIVAAGRLDLLPILEPFSELSWHWLETMKPKVRGLGMSIQTFLFPDAKPAPLMNPKPVDFRAFADPLLGALTRAVPPSLDVFKKLDNGIELEFRTPIRPKHFEDYWRKASSPERRLKKAEAPEVWEAFKRFSAENSAFLQSPAEIITLWVTGRQLWESELSSGGIGTD